MDMSAPDVSGLDWGEFYKEQSQRGIRATFTAALQARGSRAPGFAIDVGCGDGLETRALLNDGWRVLAFDADAHVRERVLETIGADSGADSDALSRPESDRLDLRRLDFGDVHELPAADLVYAGFALPFCAPEVFERLWRAIRSALQPGGVFAGEFFGPHDDWAAKAGVNVHDRAEVLRLLDDLEIVSFGEADRHGQSFAGPKHWHVFHVVARRPAAGR
jgi:Trans-aconitate methyltransferase